LVSVAVAVVIGTAACGGAAPAASGQTTIRLVLAWYPTPEYGGLYAAIQQGYFKQAGINLQVTPGGPQVSSSQIVGSGKADIGYINNDGTLLLARQNGIPVTEFGTTYEVYPEGLEYHKSNPISSLADANGRTIYAVTGSIDYQWLQNKYKLKNKVLPYSYANFAHDPKSLLLGYVTDDVPTLSAQGIDIGYIKLSDGGRNPYADALYGLETYVTSHQSALKAFLGALGNGWVYYRNHYHDVNTYMFTFNNADSVATMDSIATFQDSFIYSGDAATQGIGYISATQIEGTYNDMKSLGVITANVDLKTFADTTLVPKVLPPQKQG
jgi:NitT/TauT family transport system substrate-binding protein